MMFKISAVFCHTFKLWKGFVCFCMERLCKEYNFMFRKERLYGEEESERGDLFVDHLVENIIKDRGEYDPYFLEDKMGSFSYRIVSLNVHGEAGLCDGYLLGLRTLHRTEMCSLVEKDGTLHINSNLGVQALNLYTTVSVNFMNFKRVLTIQSTLKHCRLAFNFKVHSKTGRNGVIHELIIDELAEIQINITGVGYIEVPLNMFLSLVVIILKKLMRNIIEYLLESHIASRLQSYQFPIEILSLLVIIKDDSDDPELQEKSLPKESPFVSRLPGSFNETQSSLNTEIYKPSTEDKIEHERMVEKESLPINDSIEKTKPETTTVQVKTMDHASEMYEELKGNKLQIEQRPALDENSFPESLLSTKNVNAEAVGLDVVYITTASEIQNQDKQGLSLTEETVSFELNKTLTDSIEENKISKLPLSLPVSTNELSDITCVTDIKMSDSSSKDKTQYINLSEFPKFNVEYLDYSLDLNEKCSHANTSNTINIGNVKDSELRTNISTNAKASSEGISTVLISNKNKRARNVYELELNNKEVSLKKEQTSEFIDNATDVNIQPMVKRATNSRWNNPQTLTTESMKKIIKELQGLQIKSSEERTRKEAIDVVDFHTPELRFLPHFDVLEVLPDDIHSNAEIKLDEHAQVLIRTKSSEVKEPDEHAANNVKSEQNLFCSSEMVQQIEKSPENKAKEILNYALISNKEKLLERLELSDSKIVSNSAFEMVATCSEYKKTSPMPQGVSAIEYISATESGSHFDENDMTTETNAAIGKVIDNYETCETNVMAIGDSSKNKLQDSLKENMAFGLTSEEISEEIVLKECAFVAEEQPRASKTARQFRNKRKGAGNRKTRK